MPLRSNSQSKTTASKTADTSKERSQTTDANFDDVFGELSNTIAWFFSRPAAMYKWCTAPHGGQRIFLGSLAIYFWLCSAEAYWQALAVGEQFAKTGKLDASYIGTTHPSFMPKPFSPNTGSIQNAGVALTDPNFAITGIISIVILGVQANLQRGKKSIHKAKRDYEAVKNFKVGDVPKDAIDVVREEAKAYKESGMANHKMISGAVTASYFVDIAANVAPLWRFAFASTGSFIASAVWVYIGVFAAEKFVNLWQANEDIVKADRESKRFPRVLPFKRRDKEGDKPEPKSETA